MSPLFWHPSSPARRAACDAGDAATTRTCWHRPTGCAESPSDQARVHEHEHGEYGQHDNGGHEEHGEHEHEEHEHEHRHEHRQSAAHQHDEHEQHKERAEYQSIRARTS